MKAPKLTRRAALAAAPGPRDRFVWDGEVAGFGLKVTASGARVFVLQHRSRGVARRIVIGPLGEPWTVETARDRARRLLAELARGQDPQGVRARGRAELTVAELFALYEAEGALGCSKHWTAAVRREFRNHIAPRLGARPAASLTAADVDRLMIAIARGETAQVGLSPRGRRIEVRGGPMAADHAINVLSVVLSFAVRRNLLRDNPALGVKRFRKRPRERYLATADYERLFRVLAAAEALRALNPCAVAALRLMLLTGCRKSEVLGLTPAQVDRDGRRLLVPDAWRRVRAVPLSEAALAIVEALPARGRHQPLLRGPRGGPYRGLENAWAQVREAAGLAGVRLQDLRYSYAGLAAASGVSLPVVGRLVGSRALAAQRFAHMGDRPLRAAAERISGEIAGLLGLAEPDRPYEAGQAASDDLLGVLAAGRWLTVPEAAERCGLTASTLSHYRETGLGPPFRKLAFRVVYPEAELAAWVAARRDQPRRGRPPKALKAAKPKTAKVGSLS